jgi:hypothetical protein
MVGAITLIVFIIALVLVWFVIKYIGHLLGFFEDPMQQKVVSGIKLKKKKVKEEVVEEVVEEVEEKEWGFFTYVFVWGVVAFLIYLFFDINVFEILMFMIKGAIEGFNQS